MNTDEEIKTIESKFLDSIFNIANNKGVSTGIRLLLIEEVLHKYRRQKSDVVESAIRTYL